VQILLNNLLYDFAQVTIPTDRVDDDQMAKPRRWNIDFIRNFMVTFGPISSVFDILLFVVLLRVFNADEAFVSDPGGSCNPWLPRPWSYT